MKRNFLMAVGALGLASLGGCYAEVSPYAYQPASPVYYSTGYSTGYAPGYAPGYSTGYAAPVYRSAPVYRAAPVYQPAPRVYPAPGPVYRTVVTPPRHRYW
ncbi:MAG: hypothetical protein U1A78_04835 [Polyangia bacterium]